MKSTKYQLLEAEFESLQKTLKMYREIIEQLREENESYKKVLNRISIINTHLHKGE